MVENKCLLTIQIKSIVYKLVELKRDICHIQLDMLSVCYQLLFKETNPSKNIFTDRSKAVFLLWIIVAIHISCLSCFLVLSLKPCGHLLGKG